MLEKYAGAMMFFFTVSYKNQLRALEGSLAAEAIKRH